VKARIFGPVLLMTLGSALMLSPAVGFVGAAAPPPTDCIAPTGGQSAAGAVPPCDCKNLVVGVGNPCDPDDRCQTQPDNLVVRPPCDPNDDKEGRDHDKDDGGLPKTGSNDAGYLAIGGLLVAGGGALLVTRRRRPAPQA
jgi:LPXTG-motif cell wall-anchored protein